jgi:signal transduction histidine kinase
VPDAYTRRARVGLSIARDIVTVEFGGTLVCTDTGPAGTTFTIRPPIRPAASGERSAA